MELISQRMEPIINRAVAMRDAVRQLKDILLANLVMLGELPAETFQEERRIAFLLDRFRECGLDSISTDEANNGLAILPGSDPDRSILLSAHADTRFSAKVDHTVRVDTDQVAGPGIADNSLGLAVIASLPTVLEALGLSFKSNLILMGSSQGLGRGNLKGIRFFLDHHPHPIEAGVCVEGVQLGRLSYNSLGMLRVELRSAVPSGDKARDFTDSGAIEPLIDVIQEIQHIPIPRKPRTHITLGSIDSGNSFNCAPANGRLRLEVQSEQEGMVTRLEGVLRDLVKKVAWELGVDLEFEVIARLGRGGIGFDHPLTMATRIIMEALGITPMVRPSVGELAALISKNLPAVTLGITERIETDDTTEALRIEPIFSGIAQLISLILAIDDGICHDADK